MLSASMLIGLIFAGLQTSLQSGLPVPVAGANCISSSLRLAQNFPVDTNDAIHQIVFIDAVVQSSVVLGWIYTEENGDKLLEFSGAPSPITYEFGQRQPRSLIFIPLRRINVSAFAKLQHIASIRPCFNEYYHTSP